MSEFSSVQFLDENETRDYPLVAGSSLPLGFLLDLRLFSRGRKVSEPRVSRVVGSNESVSGDLEVYFDTGCLGEDAESPDILEVRVSGAGESSIQVFGMNQSLSVGVWSSVSATFGSEVYLDHEDDDFDPESSYVEPSLLYLCHSASIHRAFVGGSEALGRASILPSRNLRSETLPDEVVAGPDKGAGLVGLTAEEFVDLYYPEMDSAEATNPCSGALVQINGVGPDASGTFFVVPGRGVSVRTFPEASLVAIVTSLVSRKNTCPDVPELGDIYLWMLDENGNLVPTEALPEVLEPGQAWVLDQFGRLIPAEDFDFDPYWTEGGGGISP